MHRDIRFQKSTTVAEAYDPYSIDDGYEDEEEEVAAAEWNWGKKTVMVPNSWGRGVEESYDFDVTKSDNSLISCLRRDRSSCLIIMLYCPLIS